MEPYIPEQLPLTHLHFQRLLRAVGRANAELARYDGLLESLINPTLLLSPLTMQEAELSSRIEGTQASFVEVLEHEAGDMKTGEKGVDVQEIINYRHALLLAQDALADTTITLVWIRQMHKLLMSSVRGQDKSPGEFRKEQNWIGSPGCPIEQATFVPPNPLQLMDHLLAWQEYLSYQDIDPLIQTAIVHAQFELIHPFKDGNGRIGRLLIPLFLYQTKTLSQPMFYLSAYLENHREIYYDKLRRISAEGDWNGWIEFFLNAVIEQAQINSKKVRSIMNLYAAMKLEVEDSAKSRYGMRLLDTIFDRPVFSTALFVEQSGIPRPSAIKLLKKLKDSKVLVQVRESRGQIPEMIAFPALIDIVLQ